MVIVAFPPGEKYAVNYTALDQYDYGQVLRIQGLKLPKTVEVHFSTQETGGTSITRVGVTKDGVTDVLIPDSVLENGDTTQNYSIFAFVYVTDATSGKTEYRAKIEVKARPKPEVPGGGDNPDIFHEAVLEVRKSAEKAEGAQKQAEGWAHGREDLPERAEDNAMYYAGKTSEDAKKTAQDRAEVERLTESNTQMQGEVAKDLEEVKKLSSQAQTSATNAALSEQKSEEAATRAETAQTGAETAEDNAELAAQKTGQDKTAVEQAKKLVQQMGQEVLDNKNAVDKTVQDFAITAQQAFADVNNTGQAQTERVQTAGTTAVENIKTAQNTATQAVETAKAEAIKAVQTEGNKQIKAVADKGKEVIESIPEDFPTQMETKLDKNQGIEHAGKVLVVGEDGNVVPVKPETEGVGDAADAIVNTVSGTLLNIKDSAERKNKGFEMLGKTTQDGTPTPDAPVEIVNAGRLNEDTGKYEVDAKVTGKNIVNIPDISADTPEGTILCRIVDNAVVSAQEKAVASSDVWHICFYSKDGKKQYFNGTETHKAIAATPKNPIVKLEYRNVYITSGAYKGIMVEYGTVATKYEPYKEQTLTLTFDRPITKWDRLVEQDGQIGWLYNSSETILNGTEDWIRHSEINKETTQAFGLSISDLIYGEDAVIGQNGLTDKFRYVNAAWAKDEAGQAINNGRLFINIEKTKASTVEEFKAWLKSNNVKVVYKTKQTEFVPLPQEQQEAIRALQTYYPTTVVSNSEDAEMQLTYVADTKNYTDRKIEEAVTAQTQNLANLLSLMPLSTQAAMIENDTNNILDMEVQK